MSARWRETLAAGRTLILDGGVGAELQRRGMRVDPICWNALAGLAAPELLEAIHAEHIAAGAEVITTSTFATSRFVLEAAGHGRDYARINRATVAAAQRARAASGRAIAIAGSISCLPPGFDTRNYPSAMRERAAYRELAETLAELGVDLLALEMMQDTEHAARALEAAQATGLPIWLGLSCRHDRAGRLVGFDFPDIELEQTAVALAAFGPDLINVMHTPVTAVGAALERLAAFWSGPLGAYPEVGTFDPLTRTRSAAIDPAELAGLALDWRARGAVVLGGCCGADAAHIAALHAAVTT